MPYIISREQALKTITESLMEGECLACWILKSKSNYTLKIGEHTTTVLSKYPRTWGQTMILLNSHKEKISEISNEEWQELMIEVKNVTTKIEKTLKPLRCYVSSLGSTENLPNTCPHIHFNLIPIYNIQDKPSDIFTWENGVYNASVAEWEDLFNHLTN